MPDDIVHLTASAGGDAPGAGSRSTSPRVPASDRSRSSTTPTRSSSSRRMMHTIRSRPVGDRSRWPRGQGACATVASDSSTATSGSNSITPTAREPEADRSTAPRAAPIGPISGDDVRRHAIHGTTFARRWDVVSATADRLEVTCRLDGALGWDLPGIARQVIALSPTRLDLALSVEADDGAIFPAAVGWHPWFAKPDRLVFTPSQCSNWMTSGCRRVDWSRRPSRPGTIVSSTVHRSNSTTTGVSQPSCRSRRPIATTGCCTTSPSTPRASSRNPDRPMRSTFGPNSQHRHTPSDVRCPSTGERPSRTHLKRTVENREIASAHRSGQVRRRPHGP